jgi:hypothetical protein
MTLVANAFKTTINKPTLDRNFILPTPSTTYSGYWYNICNKATSYTIVVQYPLGTTIYTIPVSPTGGAGSVARFTCDGISYFRSG